MAERQARPANVIRLGGARQPANGSEMRPEVVDRQWSATAVQARVCYRCANAEATKKRSREGLEAEPVQTRVLAEALKLLSQDCRFLAEVRHDPRWRPASHSHPRVGSGGECVTAK